MSRIVTLTTDFGRGDYDAGVLIGVILRLAPDAQVVDLSHDIERHNVLEAALLLERCTPYFPERTIHVAVVDPGVGTERRGLAARLGGQWFVGPDNGLLTLMRRAALSAGQEVEIIHLDRPEFWLSHVSHIFHGRDIFASVAGHLAAGVPFSQLGGPLEDPVLLDAPQVLPTAGGWQGAVMHVDAFGNLSTNLEAAHLQGSGSPLIRIRGRQIHGLVRTFGDGGPGELVALIDSVDRLSLCVVNGNAASTLGVKAGERVEVGFEQLP
jgi:hypothetical protein